MSFQYRDQCYDTEEQLIDAMVVDIHGRVVDFNGVPALMNAEASDYTVSAWAVSDSGAGPVSTISIRFVECGSMDPFMLSNEQGVQIAIAIVGIWALAFVFRMLIRVLNVDNNGEST